MATRLTQTGQEVQEILNKSTVSGQNIENVFGVGAGSDEILEPEQWLSGIKEYIDAGNTEDLYLLDHSPVVGESMEDIIEQLALSKAIIIRPPHVCEFEIASASQIPGENGYYIFSIKYYPEDDYCSQLRYKISGESGNRVEGVEEREFLMTDTANMTFLKISAANAEYLKKADAENIYMRKSGGTFTSDVYFAGGLTSRQGRFYGVVTHQANVDMDGHRIQNLSEPTSPGDAVNKQHIDNNFYTKSEVDQKIQTETAEFKGTYDTWSDVSTNRHDFPGEKVDNNDYIVVLDSSGYESSYKGTWRFKYSGSGVYSKDNWHPEYQINEEPLTPEQLAAINSGITSTKVGKLDALPTNSELQTELSGKQATLIDSGAGKNFKKINGQSLLGSGDDIVISSVASGYIHNSTPLYIDLDLSPTTFLLNGTDSSSGKEFCYLIKTSDFDMGSETFNSFVLLAGDDVLTFTVGSDDFGDILLQISVSNDTLVNFMSLTSIAAEFYELQGSFVGSQTVTPIILQQKLVSGTNIKTINNTSLLGSGDIQISADTSDCVKFGETISAENHYLKIDGAGVPFSLMLVVRLDDYTSEYLVNGTTQMVNVVKMEGDQSFDGMLRIDEDTYFPIALYHEDSLSVTPILLSGTMPTITDLASASGEDEEIPSFQTKKELPSGGTAGQVLTKASGTDYDVEWADGGDSGATIITNDGSEGDSVAIRLTDNQFYKRSFRIDMTAEYTGGSNEQRIGSLIVECYENSTERAHGYYYGDTLADILSEVAVYQDDTDPDTFYLMLQHDSSLDFVTFAITPLDGGEVDAFTTNAGDDHTKIEDATITPVGGSSDVFVAEYRVTPFADILAAYNANKEVICNYNRISYRMASYLISGGAPTYIYFSSLITYPGAACIAVKNDETWTMQTLYLERTLDKVSTIFGNETNTTKYPNTKAVADALGKIGVISQTQTWSGSGSNPRTYTIDPASIVRGIIPQANIDLFESAGATFNESTGYFELNGLTDISYEEMKVVYDASGAARSNFRTRESQFAYCEARTLLPIIQPYMTAFPTQITTMIYHSACESIGFYALGNPGQPFNVASQGLTNLANTCEKLKKFVGIINISSVTNANSATTPFTNCYSLEDISLKGIKVSVAFGNSPNLSKASLLYMINNEASTSAITITLHASVYAKCQSGGEWYSDISTALAAHTNVSLASA